MCNKPECPPPNPGIVSFRFVKYFVLYHLCLLCSLLNDATPWLASKLSLVCNCAVVVCVKLILFNAVSWTGREKKRGGGANLEADESLCHLCKPVLEKTGAADSSCFFSAVLFVCQVRCSFVVLLLDLFNTELSRIGESWELYLMLHCHYDSAFRWTAV